MMLRFRRRDDPASGSSHAEDSGSGRTADVLVIVTMVITLAAVGSYAPPFQGSPGSRSMSVDDTSCAPASGAQR